MAAIEIPSVLAVDVGSPKAGRLGWADRAAHGGARAESVQVVSQTGSSAGSYPQVSK